MARGSVFQKDNGWAFRTDAGVNPATGKRRSTSANFPFGDDAFPLAT